MTLAHESDPERRPSRFRSWDTNTPAMRLDSDDAVEQAHASADAMGHATVHADAKATSSGHLYGESVLKLSKRNTLLMQ